MADKPQRCGDGHKCCAHWSTSVPHVPFYLQLSPIKIFDDVMLAHPLAHWQPTDLPPSLSRSEAIDYLRKQPAFSTSAPAQINVMRHGDGWYVPRGTRELGWLECRTIPTAIQEREQLERSGCRRCGGQLCSAAALPAHFAHLSQIGADGSGRMRRRSPNWKRVPALRARQPVRPRLH